MIRPHQSEQLKPLIIQDRAERDQATREAEKLPSAMVSSASVANAVMLGGGYFTPLPGFMNKADALSVSKTLHTQSGLFWPIPVLCRTESISGLKAGYPIALKDSNLPDSPVIAIIDNVKIETIGKSEVQEICKQVYRTSDADHPGVKDFLDQGNVILSGPTRVLNFSYFEKEFPDTFRTAVQIRKSISNLGWEKVVAFQTRNPMHRAHEELCRTAMKRVEADGCIIHMLLGKLKSGDIPADIRDAAIRAMVDGYFEPNQIMITGYGFDMLYAGPREAVLHAIFRQNMGATHFIIGRDHAGVGDYYGAFDAQAIFDEEVPKDALDIEIFRADHTAWSKKLNKVVMMREAPNHQISDFLLISGTKLREMLSQGEVPPPEISRPEVAKILIDHYKNIT
ncbi:MAG: sulfate adenylyltransferase [Gammaproteobacteria bacterium]|nr:sulfate adenylyltransferase [Gammaproteobacteria bacterium]MCY4218691.1 sulfate adenylyltransferase [Gammaproteobacteria bacterium]MCY4273825.1 sulfate adenylyltransferase [Gammaproteobacteria bacterium]